jgi:hypothetical protein
LDLELPYVELLFGAAEDIAGSVVLDPLSAQDLPKEGQVTLEGLTGPCRRIPVPNILDQ